MAIEISRDGRMGLETAIIAALTHYQKQAIRPEHKPFAEPPTTEECWAAYCNEPSVKIITNITVKVIREIITEEISKLVLFSNQ